MNHPSIRNSGVFLRNNTIMTTAAKANTKYKYQMHRRNDLSRTMGFLCLMSMMTIGICFTPKLLHPRSSLSSSPPLSSFTNPNPNQLSNYHNPSRLFRIHPIHPNRNINPNIYSNPNWIAKDSLHPSKEQYSKWVEKIIPFFLNFKND